MNDLLAPGDSRKHAAFRRFYKRNFVDGLESRGVGINDQRYCYNMTEVIVAGMSV